MDGGVGLDAQENIVQAAVGFADIMAVVGRDHRRAGLCAEASQQRQDLTLRLDTVILQFDKVILFAEQILIVSHALQCGRIIIAHQELRDLAREAR